MNKLFLFLTVVGLFSGAIYIIHLDPLQKNQEAQPLVAHLDDITFYNDTTWMTAWYYSYPGNGYRTPSPGFYCQGNCHDLYVETDSSINHYTLKEIKRHHK